MKDIFSFLGSGKVPVWKMIVVSGFVAIAYLAVVLGTSAFHWHESSARTKRVKESVHALKKTIHENGFLSERLRSDTKWLGPIDQNIKNGLMDLAVLSSEKIRMTARPSGNTEDKWFKDTAREVPSSRILWSSPWRIKIGLRNGEDISAFVLLLPMIQQIVSSDRGVLEKARIVSASGDEDRNASSAVSTLECEIDFYGTAPESETSFESILKKEGELASVFGWNNGKGIAGKFVDRMARMSPVKNTGR
jgi:hypothetical protein